MNLIIMVAVALFRQVGVALCIFTVQSAMIQTKVEVIHVWLLCSIQQTRQVSSFGVHLDCNIIALRAQTSVSQMNIANDL